MIRFRKTGEGDRSGIAAALSADPYHRGQTAEFYLHGDAGDGAEVITLEDEAGAVMYARVERVCRVHMQFVAAQGPREKARVARALVTGLAWLRARCLKVGLREIIFDSRAPLLIGFATARMGFRQSRDELVSTVGDSPSLATTRIGKASPEAAGPRQGFGESFVRNGCQEAAEIAAHGVQA